MRNFGSGWVRWVYEETDNSGRKYWEVGIFTARHVIYDRVEAAKCSITLFDVGDPQLTPVTLSGGKFVRGHTEDDWCRMEFTTEDESLGEKLRSLCDRGRDVVRKVQEKVEKSRCSEEDERNSPVLLLTYPHGKQCHATLGRMRKVDVKGVDGLFTSVYYSTDSCPGSSGGLVLPVGRLDDKFKWMMSHPHSGADPESGHNLSAGWEVSAWGEIL